MGLRDVSVFKRLFFFLLRLKPFRELAKRIPFFERITCQWELEKIWKVPFSQAEFVKRVEMQEENIARLFLKAGMPVNSINSAGDTGLIVASRKGYAKLVRLLLKQKEIEIDKRNGESLTALHEASISGFEEVFDMLMAAGADNSDLKKVVAKYKLSKRNVDCNEKEFLRRIRYNMVNEINLFLEAGVNPNAMDKDDQQNSALILAVESGNSELVRLLLEQPGIEVDARNINRESALIIAVLIGDTVSEQLLRDAHASNWGLDEALLREALKNRDFEMINVLLKKGISLKGETKHTTPPLVDAVNRNFLAAVQLLLKNNASTEVKDYEGKTPLMRAAERGYTTIVKELLQYNAYVDEIDPDGSTALIMAASRGYSEIVALLLKYGADVNRQDNFGWNSLAAAIQSGQTEVQRLLREKRAIKGENAAGLLDASARGDIERVQQILSFGTEKNIRDNNGNSPLSVAAAKGFIDIVKLLVIQGLNVNVKNKQLWTPLMEAAKAGHTSVVNFLLEKGAAVEFRNKEGNTAFLLAASRGRVDIVKLLLKRVKDIDERNDNEHSALVAACDYGSAAVVELLVNEGANVNQSLKYGYSPLMLSALVGHSRVVELLKEKGAERGLLEMDLFIAAKEGNAYKVKALIDSGAVVIASDKWGKTALMEAALRGHEDVLRLLIAKGAHIEASALDGQTALQLAASKGWTASLRILLEGIQGEELRRQLATSALIEAVENGHAEAVQLLHTLGNANVNISYNRYGDTPLILASAKGYAEVVRILLAIESIDVNRRGRHGNTALMVAMLEGRDEIIDMLEEVGAEYNIIETNLIVAAKKGDTQWFEKHLTMHGNILARDRDGKTALICACEKGYFDIARSMLEYAAQDESISTPGLINAQANSGKTALINACEKGNLEIVKLLLHSLKNSESTDEGTNRAQLEKSINMQTKSNRTALMEACKHGHFEIAEFIIDQLSEVDKIRAAVNAADRYKNTPLKEALIMGYSNIIELLEKNYAEAGRVEADLLDAAQRCNINRMETLIEQKPDINCRNRKGRTPLMEAAAAGCKEAVMLLLAKGAEVERKDINHKTALALAAENGHTDVISVLLKQGGTEPNAGNEPIIHPLIAAVSNGHETAADILLQYNANVNIRENSGQTPLIIAAKKDYTSIVELLAARGDIDIEATDANGRTALMTSHLGGVVTGIPERLVGKISTDKAVLLRPTESILVNAGARLGWNEAELLLAVKQADLPVNREEWVKQLIDLKVNLQARDQDKNTALIIAAGNGYEDIVQILLDRGVDRAALNEQRRTALMEASKAGYSHIVEKIASETMNLNTRDKNKDTALIEAARSGSIDSVTYLLHAGAQIDLRNKKGETALIEAVRRGKADVVEIFINKGAEISDCNISGRTALMEASERGYLHIVKMLLGKLAKHPERMMQEINAIDRSGCTAWDLAFQKNYTESCRELEQNGALPPGDPKRKTVKRIVWITPTGDCYHTYTCAHVDQARAGNKAVKKRIEKAETEGYKACIDCKP